MAALVESNVVTPALRMQRHLHEYHCADGVTIWDVILAIQRDRRFVDEIRFLLRLAQKVPLLLDLPPEVVGRFHGSEPVGPAIQDGDALVFAVHTGGVSISLPFAQAWDADRLTILFDEIDDAGNILRVEESIDHLSRSVHSAAIIARDREVKKRDTTRDDFWNRRQSLFPCLEFGPDVENHLRVIDEGLFRQILNRLSELDTAAEEWPRLGGPAPLWRSKVSPESESRLNNQVILNRMTFASIEGSRELFQWHARYGGAGRIHLRFDPATYVVEIGYIGRKID